MVRSRAGAHQHRSLPHQNAVHRRAELQVRVDRDDVSEPLPLCMAQGLQTPEVQPCAGQPADRLRANVSRRGTYLLGMALTITCSPFM